MYLCCTDRVYGFRRLLPTEQHFKTQELSYHLLKGLHAPHSLVQNNCFHSEEDLNNIFLSISSAMAKVTDNTFLENVKTLITIYNIYQG